MERKIIVADVDTFDAEELKRLEDNGFFVIKAKPGRRVEIIRETLNGNY